MSIFESYRERFDQHLQEEYSLQEYLELCKKDPLVYATAAERMLAAIGEPELVDTSQAWRRRSNKSFPTSSMLRRV
jgi:serine protein kinase